jgi:hypothetical protein
LSIVIDGLAVLPVAAETPLGVLDPVLFELHPPTTTSDPTRSPAIVD